MGCDGIWDGTVMSVDDIDCNEPKDPTKLPDGY